MMKFKKIFQIFEKIENLSIFNIEQRALFDKVLNYFMFFIKKQFFFKSMTKQKRENLCVLI
jgi:hypothetical protein